MFFINFFPTLRTWTSPFWLLGAILWLVANPASAQQNWGSFGGPYIAARSAVLMNPDTGEVLFAKEPHLRLPPASTTKVLTAMVAMERLSPYSPIQASAQAASTAPSRIGLRTGDIASTQDLLYGLLLKSGNDAAESLAEAAGGSIYGFANLMNAKAWQIGVRNSHFNNPHGLPDEDHYSTAYDLALIFRNAMTYRLFADIVGTQSAILRINSGSGPFSGSRLVPVSNHNRLLKTYEGAQGGKTGFTLKARRCFVGEVDRGGVRLIVSILNSPSSKTLWDDAETLLDYGFSRYGLASPPSSPSMEEPGPIIVQRTPIMTPDAERLAALSTTFEQKPEPAILRQNVVEKAAPITIKRSSDQRPAAATYPTSGRKALAQSIDEEDEEPQLVWSRPTVSDSRPARHQLATTIATKEDEPKVVRAESSPPITHAEPEPIKVFDRPAVYEGPDDDAMEAFDRPVFKQRALANTDRTRPAPKAKIKATAKPAPVVAMGNSSGTAKRVALPSQLTPADLPPKLAVVDRRPSSKSSLPTTTAKDKSVLATTAKGKPTLSPIAKAKPALPATASKSSVVATTGAGLKGGKVEKTNKPLVTIAIKIENRTSNKIIARTEPVTPKPPQKALKRRI